MRTLFIFSVVVLLAGDQLQAQATASTDNAAKERTAASEEVSAGQTKAAKVIANWTGSADMTTQLIEVSPGALELIWLAIPKGTGASSLTITVYDEQQRTIQTVTSGAISSKRQELSRVRSVPETTRVRLAVTGQNVLWGVWAQVRADWE